MRALSKLLGVAGLAGTLACSSAAVAAKTVTLALVAAGLNHPFEVSVAKAFQDAGKKAGVNTIVLDSKTDVARQANNVDDLIAQGVDGIALLPLDSVVAQGWVDRVSENNIPIVAVAVDIGDPHKRATKDVYPKLAALVANDQVHAGEIGGQMAAAMLPKNRVAKIAIVEGMPGAPQVWQLSKGFKAGLDKSGARYLIVASQPTDWTPERGQAVCQNILTAHPDIDLFYNEADDMVIGCAKAVRAAGSSAKLLGWGGSHLGLDAIKSGAVDGTVCASPGKIGSAGFDALYAAVAKTNTAKARFVEVATPPITKANLASCPPQW